MKRLIQTTIKPKYLGIKVKKVVKTARGLMIETEKLQKLQECDALKTKGLVVEAALKICPKLLEYDVNWDKPDQEVLEDIFSQNVDDMMQKKNFLKNSDAYTNI